MLVKKNITLKGILEFAGHHFWWLTTYMFTIALLYKLGWQWISIPWLPVSLIGTAVAFYVGFKNNQSYDRVWEARKIWGAVVNSSRSWAVMINAYVRKPDGSEAEIKTIKTALIYRHIAWLYTLREQLLVPTQWEHVSLKHLFGRLAAQRRERFGIGQFNRGNFPGGGLKHQLTEFDNDQLIYVGNFLSFAEAKSYADGITPQLKQIMKVPAGIYSSFIISKENFEKLRNKELVTKYLDFYKNNY